MERQTVKTQIRLLFKEELSDLGLHCLLKNMKKLKSLPGKWSFKCFVGF